ncbi:MAG: hypothetical protein AAGE84_04015 [Cyanobacteria bacterium P01_G01_bin.39]
MTATTLSQNRIQEIKEMAIAIAIKELTPLIITENFVRENEIVSSDWKLTQAPFVHHDRSQLSFDSRVTILAKQNGIAFIERIKDDNAPLQIESVADRCVARLTDVEYQGLKLETKRLISIPNNDAARSYLTEFLVASGAWQNYGQAPVKTGINFLYDLGRCKLTMAISEATIRQENKEDTGQQDIGGLLFSGTFAYPAFKGDKIIQAKETIANCSKDWQEFNQMIDRVFLDRENGMLQRIMFE